MKTILKITAMIFLALYFTACGGESGGASSAAPSDFLRGDPIYSVKVFGDANFACSFITNFGDEDQGELLTNPQTVASPDSKEWTVTGRNLVGQCSQSSGVGVLTIEVYRNGTLYEIKNNAGNLTSAHFNADL